MSEYELNENELQRILTGEEELEPMTGFSTRVMRAVREEATAPPPIAFPWARFLPGVILNLALLLGASAWAIVEFGGSPQGVPFPVERLADPQTRGLLWAALTTIGSGVLAWIAAKASTSRQSAFF